MHIKLLVPLSIFLTMGAIFFWIFDVADAVTFSFFVAATIIIIGLLGWIYSVASKIDGVEYKLFRHRLQLYILLHIVPLGYVILYALSTEMTWLINFIYLILVIWFFFIGRQVWQFMFEVFGSKIYRVFFLGNTAMLIWSPVLFVFGVLYENSIFSQSQVVYCLIHFLLAGFVANEMNRDVPLIGKLND